MWRDGRRPTDPALLLLQGRSAHSRYRWDGFELRVLTLKPLNYHSFFCLNYYRPRSEASEGYVFTGVCHSFCSTGEGGRWVTPKVITPPSPSKDQVTTPPPPPGTRSQHLPPSPPTRTMRRRAVRILLECILVYHKFTWNIQYFDRRIASQDSIYSSKS